MDKKLQAKQDAADASAVDHVAKQSIEDGMATAKKDPIEAGQKDPDPVPAKTVVRLSHPAADAQKSYVTDVVLENGMAVAYRDSAPVVYAGDVAAFVRDFSNLCHPARVKIDEQDAGEKTVTVEGVTVKVPVKRRHLRLIDG